MLLLDNSAWSRLLAGTAPADRAEAIADLMVERRLATCLPFLLEAGYSARSAADRDGLMARLAYLPRMMVDQSIESLALRAQRELAIVGHHRVAPADLVIAACAHQADAGVLHYDRDYDLIAEYTGLSFASEWLAPAGSL
jgi:predicted nucleic acid-binding protein